MGDYSDSLPSLAPCLRLVGGLAVPRHVRDQWAAAKVRACIAAGVQLGGVTPEGQPLLVFDVGNEGARSACRELRDAIRQDSKAIERALWEATTAGQIGFAFEVCSLSFERPAREPKTAKPGGG